MPASLLFPLLYKISIHETLAFCNRTQNLSNPLLHTFQAADVEVGLLVLH